MIHDWEFGRRVALAVAMPHGTLCAHCGDTLHTSLSSLSVALRRRRQQQLRMWKLGGPSARKFCRISCSTLWKPFRRSTCTWRVLHLFILDFYRSLTTVLPPSLISERKEGAAVVALFDAVFRRLIPTVIFGFSSARLTAAAKESNWFAVCKLIFCSSRQRKTFYTTSQVL